MNILRFTEAPMKDESIEEYEHHEYKPITGIQILITQVRLGSTLKRKISLLTQVRAI